MSPDCLCVCGEVGFTVVDNTGQGCGVPGSMENTGSRGLWKTRGPGVTVICVSP